MSLLHVQAILFLILSQNSLRFINVIILFFKLYNYFRHAYPETAYITTTPTGAIGPITVCQSII